MEENSPRQEQLNPTPEDAQKGNLKNVAFLKKGIFEIIFIATALFLLFGILNYFNILPISDTFPKYLAFLPKQSTQQKNTSPSPQTFPSPLPTVSLEKNAREAITKFFSDNLTASVIPQSFAIKLSQPEAENNSFTATWQTDAGTASVLFNLSPSNPQEISYLYLEIPFLTKSKVSFSPAFAQSQAPKFFSTNPQGSWKCKLFESITFCENFWERNTTKTGMGINGSIVRSNNQIVNTASLCQFHKDSGLFSRKSCIADLEQ